MRRALAAIVAVAMLAVAMLAGGGSAEAQSVA